MQFQTVEHARKVLEEVRYPEIKGVRCRALPYSRPTGGASLSSGAEKKPTTFQLFVKGIPARWTHHELYENFKPYGRIISAKVSIDGDFKSRGYGFVQFEALDAAQTAIKEMNGKDLSEEEDAKLEALETLSVCEFIPKADRNGVQQPKCGTNLYVKNFPENDFGDQELRERFEVFGEIASAAVMRDDSSGSSKGFGFVNFKCWQDAQKALDELKGAMS